MATQKLHCFFNSSIIINRSPLQISTPQNFPRKDLPSITLRNQVLNQSFHPVTTLFSEETYSSLLDHCAFNKSLSQGTQVHALIITSNALTNSLFLQTRLVFMYCKCDSLFDARKMFDQMPLKTTFTWNAMINAYATNYQTMEAIKLFHAMCVSDAPLDSCTFTCFLKVCFTLEGVRQIHSMALKFGYVSDVVVSNAFLDGYGKCDDLHSARRQFDAMTTKDQSIVSWNSIISSYCAYGKNEEALELFRRMQKLKLGASSYTFVAVLQVCGDARILKLGMEIHSFIVKSNPFPHIFVVNSLIVMYTRCGRMKEAEFVFEAMGEKDDVSWNSMLTGFVKNGLFEEAFPFFRSMQVWGQKPDSISLLSISLAAGQSENLLKGKEVHGYAIKHGFDSKLYVVNTLMDMYSKCGYVVYMNSIFDSMNDKDVISWMSIIAGNSQNNCYFRALKLFVEALSLGIRPDETMIGSILIACRGIGYDSLTKEIHCYILRKGLDDQMLWNSVLDAYGGCVNVDYAIRVWNSMETRNGASYTSMVSILLRHGLANEGLEHFRLMQEKGIEPDSIALLGILSASANLSILRTGKEIHGVLIRKGYHGVDCRLGNSLLDMYARCGTIKYSRKVFNYIMNKNQVLWSCMINAYGMHGCGKEAIETFHSMVDRNFTPNQITFLALLRACSHSGLINEGQRFFEVMKDEYGLDPWPEHCSCMVDLLARSNRIEEAYEFTKKMKIQASPSLWSALLSACHRHSNEEIGLIAAKTLLEIEPEYAGNYVLISNTLAANGRWEDMAEVRRKMKEKGLKKTPGYSWIELGQNVHVFRARDRSHIESKEIYRKLKRMTLLLEEKGGYVAQTKLVLQEVSEETKKKIIYGHSERLAIAYGLLKTREGSPIRVTKNLRICTDCHTFTKLVSKWFEREIVVRDASRFHHFQNGVCSCSDFW